MILPNEILLEILHYASYDENNINYKSICNFILINKNTLNYYLTILGKEYKHENILQNQYYISKILVIIVNLHKINKIENIGKYSSLINFYVKHNLHILSNFLYYLVESNQKNTMFIL